MNKFNKYKTLVDLTPLSDFCRQHSRLCKYAKEDVFRFIQEYVGITLQSAEIEMRCKRKTILC